MDTWVASLESRGRPFAMQAPTNSQLSFKRYTVRTRYPISEKLNRSISATPLGSQPMDGSPTQSAAQKHERKNNRRGHVPKPTKHT